MSMTEDEQRIALCEWMGWKTGPDLGGVYVSDFSWYKQEGGWLRVTKTDTNSLDVLRLMEAKLDWLTTKRYLEQLSLYTAGVGNPVFATAAQRREALLRTLNLWQEPKP
jgi:hypothetical protein